jgi:FG-GAP repeat
MPNFEGLSEPNDQVGWAFATGDFNRDGFDDLATGVPHEDVGDDDASTAIRDGGVVNIIYGSAGGLSLTVKPDQVWTKADVAARTYNNDNFGWSITSGDYNADGYADLGIGGTNFVSGPQTGSMGFVGILYGSPSGISKSFVKPDFRGQSNSQYGFSLTTGNFDGDAFDDIAAGAPTWADCPTSCVPHPLGIVYIWYVSAGRTQNITQNTGGVEDESELNDRFGHSLIAADFDNDGYDDIAIGAPNEDLNGIADAGAVNVIYGQDGGLSAVDDPNRQGGDNDQLFFQDTEGLLNDGTRLQVEDKSEKQDRFGIGLMSADYNGDDDYDLAIAVSYEDVSSDVQQLLSDAGGINVIYGCPCGLRPDGLLPDQFWTQDSKDVKDFSEVKDQMGDNILWTP